jgi:hypothetical protein
MRIAKTMNRKKPTVEFDGPTLNEHPVLSVADVQAWFRTAKCDAPADAALAIAQMLNEYELLGALWKSTPALQEMDSTPFTVILLRIQLKRCRDSLLSERSQHYTWQKT